MKECTIIKGKPVADRITEEVIKDVEKLKVSGIEPSLAIVRVGENPDDMSYERGAVNRCGKTGINVVNVVLSEDISEQEYIKEIENLNERNDVNAILCLRPLPKHIDENKIKNIIEPSKDVDCFSSINTAKVFEGDKTGFAPCTPSAVVEILKYYDINLSGAKVGIAGRSMVVGKPVSMLLMDENATVKICHSRTQDMEKELSDSDIVIAAIGKAEMIDSKYIKEDAVVIDVGINVNSEGKLCGDIDADSVMKKAGMLTPVPGGVGSVTTSVLAKHVVKACRQQNGL